MSDQTILVKKSDGTFVRVPLTEVQKMQTSQPAAAATTVPGSSSPSVAPAPTESKPMPAPSLHHKKTTSPAPTHHAAPVHHTPAHHPAKPAPALPKKMEKPKPLHLSAKKPMLEPMKPGLTVAGENDSWSLLDEPAPGAATAAAPLKSEPRDEQVDKIIARLDFSIPPGNMNRLRTVLQLFLKDIRTAEQTREILERKEIDGGLGLTGVQTGEVLEKAGYQNPLAFVPKPSKVEASGLKMTKATNARLEKELPQVMPAAPASNRSVTPPTPARPPAAAAAFTPKPAVPPATKQALDAAVTRATMAEAPLMPASFKLNTEARPKTSMADVTAKKPLEMTPVDEIRFFTLTDFRRLAQDPTEAARRLKQKFTNLKDESIVLFFDALGAWQAAPLFQEYLAVVSQALSGGVPVVALMQDTSHIQMAEIAALVDMEKALS